MELDRPGLYGKALGNRSHGMRGCPQHKYLMLPLGQLRKA